MPISTLNCCGAKRANAAIPSCSARSVAVTGIVLTGPSNSTRKVRSFSQSGSRNSGSTDPIGLAKLRRPCRALPSRATALPALHCYAMQGRAERRNVVLMPHQPAGLC